MGHRVSDKPIGQANTNASMLVVKPDCSASRAVLRHLSRPIRTLQEITNNRPSFESDYYRYITRVSRIKRRMLMLSKPGNVALALRTEACSMYRSLKNSDPNTSGRQKSVLIDPSRG